MKEKLIEKKVVSELFMIIAVLYTACLILSNLVAGKMWAMADNITLPAAVVLFPVTYIISDILTEVYGFNAARKVIWLGFFSSFLAVIIYVITVALPHPSYWDGQAAFESVLGQTFRVTAASFIGYLFGEFSNAIVLSKLKVKSEGKGLWLRAILSTIVGEGFDSVIFITISFWGVMDNSVVLSMILYQYLFKVCFEIVFSPLTCIIIPKVKKHEDTDVYDKNIKYKVVG